MAELRYVIDGHTEPDIDSPLAGDGRYPPFHIFDIEAQQNVPGHIYKHREDAEAALRQLQPPKLKEFEVTLVLRVEAQDEDAAQNLAFDANNHLRETFNDNGTIGATAFKVEPFPKPPPMTNELARETLRDAYASMEILQAKAEGPDGVEKCLRGLLKDGAPMLSLNFLIRYCRGKGLDDGTDRVLEAINFLNAAEQM